MNSLPLSLPLIDGCFLFDNSSLETFQSCPYEYQLAHLHRRILAADRAGMNFGSGCHLALKSRYSLYGSNQCGDVSSLHEVLISHFTEHPEPVGDYRNLNMAIEWLDAYNKLYKKEPFEILKLHDGRPFIERSFMRPFAFIEKGKVKGLPSTYQIEDVKRWVNQIKQANATPVFFTGRIDLGIRSLDKDDEWLMDHKSAFQFGKSFMSEMQANPQFRGYGWEFSKYFGRMPRGFIVNAFRIRPPTREAQYDTSKLFRISGPDPDFLRIPVEFTEAMLSEWEENTFSLLEEILWHFERRGFGKHKKSCVGKYGPCQFYELCNAVAPEHRDRYLESGTFTDNNWSPLNITGAKE